jgi:hypothetical protein
MTSSPSFLRQPGDGLAGANAGRVSAPEILGDFASTVWSFVALLMRYRPPIHSAGGRMGLSKARDQVAVPVLSNRHIFAHECDATQTSLKSSAHVQGKRDQERAGPVP